MPAIYWRNDSVLIGVDAHGSPTAPCAYHFPLREKSSKENPTKSSGENVLAAKPPKMGTVFARQRDTKDAKMIFMNGLRASVEHNAFQ
eukprot:2791175-Amphidinium_carterae.1